MGSQSCGVLTIAFGDPKYQHEASGMIRSLHRHSPNLPVAVVTDRPWVPEVRPDHVLLRTLDDSLRRSVYGWKAQHVFPASPYERTLYLDPDILVTSDLLPIFGLLDWYDVAFRFFGPPLNEPGGLTYHSKVHGGVFLFKKNLRTERFFEIHLQLFREAVGRALDSGSSPIIDDERTLAVALARSEARPTHLADYLAFHAGELSAVWHPPVLYHGRLDGLTAIDKRLRRSWTDTVGDVEKRLWIPRSRVFLRVMSARWRQPALFFYLAFRKYVSNWLSRSSSRA